MVDRIDVDTPGSPGWWLKTLGTQLHNRKIGRDGNRRWTRDSVDSSSARPGLDLLDAYRRGDPPLREDIHTSWAAPFRQYVRMGRLNFAEKLVSPTANRMGIRGFRTAAANDELGDQEAHKLMRRNKLPLVNRDIVDDMLSFGDGYAMVTPPDARRPIPLVTSESPLECITAHDAATGERLAGLKMFRDDWDARDWGYLFLPGGELWVAYKDGPSSLGHRGPFRMAPSWQWDLDRFDDIPGGHIPIVRFRNKRGVGEFEGHLNHLDRINDKIFNEWWISKIQAFRQRALQRDGNVPEVEEDTDLDAVDPGTSLHQVEETLQQMFVSAPDAMWDLPPGAKLWESTPVSVDPLVNSIQKELQWLASAADKPLASLNPDAANQTAEGATNQKEEHLYQVFDRRDRAESSWAETIAMAFEFAGDGSRADVAQIEVIWGPIELYSLQQKAEADSKAGSLPLDVRRRDIWQYDPTELPDMRTMDGRDRLLQRPAAVAGGR